MKWNVATFVCIYDLYVCMIFFGAKFVDLFGNFL